MLTKFLVTCVALVAVGTALSCSKGNKTTDPPDPPGTLAYQWVERLAVHNNSFGTLVTNGSSLLAIGRHVYHSTTGEDWTMTPGFGDPLMVQANLKATWAGSQYIAVTGASIYRSSDGTNWQNVNAAVPGLLRGVAYGPSIVVVVGDSGTVLSSTNGSAWTAHPLGTKVGLYDIAWDSQYFRAVGDSGVIFSSPNGITWTRLTSPSTARLERIFRAGSQSFLYGINQFYTSLDGVSWEPTNAASILGGPFQVFGVAWSGTQFVAVAVANNGYGGPICLRSSDGVTWSKASVLGSCFPTSLLWKSSQFVMTTLDGSVLMSPDATEWSIALPGKDCAVTRASKWAQGFIAVGPNAYALSTDGLSWQLKMWNRPGSGPASVASSGSMIAAVTGSNYVQTSSNGANWQITPIGDSADHIMQVAWSGTQFVAIGKRIQFNPNAVAVEIFSATSATGANWAVHHSVVDPPSWIPFALTAGESSLLSGFVYNANSLVERTTDGANWVSVNTTSFNSMLIRDLTWGSGRFLVSAGLGVLYESPDGLNWTEVAVKVGYQMDQIVSAGPRSFAFLDDGTVLSSEDRRTWSSSAWTNNPQGDLANADVLWDDGKFVAVGQFNWRDATVCVIMTSVQVAQ